LTVDRSVELKYRDCVEQIVGRLQSQPGEVWSRFAGAIRSGRGAAFEAPDLLVEQLCLEAVRACPEPELRLLWLGTEAPWKRGDAENPDSRTGWEEGVVKELYQRVRYAAGEVGLEAGELEEPAAGATEVRFCLDEDDLVFLSKVARQLAQLTDRPGLASEQSRAIRRAVDALKRLPSSTPGLDVEIEVSHRMGSEEFRETYRYVIKLGQTQVAISSSGTQGRPGAGTSSFDLESMEWQADGQSAHKGSRDSWLERLMYALGRDYTLSVTGGSVRGGGAATSAAG
jgi:hypothetical protein